MKRIFRSPMALGFATSLIVGICITVGILAWYGYRATREWRHSLELLAQRRAEETADVLLRALLRDMRGVEDEVLRPLHWAELQFDRPYEIVNLVASAFARYPYPQAFFGWSGQDAAHPVFFARADRPLPWLTLGESERRFPVVVVTDAAEAYHLMATLATGGAEGRAYSAFQTRIGDAEYQVIAKLMYRDSRRDRLEAVFGFVVDLAWVREHYFPSLVAQVARVVPSVGLSMTLSDQRNVPVAGRRAGAGGGPVAVRRLRPLFFDPSVVSASRRLPLPPQEWTVEVRAAPEPPVPFAVSPDRALLIAAAAAIVMAAGLLLTARAVRTNADLAKVRADFVASVTHELKTPLTTIRTIADTFMRGRLGTPRELAEYAQILDDETKRLIRLVDNLLTYSRVTDVSEVYVFEPLAPADLIEDALSRFQPQFAHSSVAVALDVAPDLPLVRADRVAWALVLDNLIDNALRYSTAPRWLGISAERQGDFVRIDVKDRGVGIPADEIASVAQRFVRGRRAASSGSGLGLAIVCRVVHDHDGLFGLESDPGLGTTVSVSLPTIQS